MLADSHCHLNYAGLAERQDEILARARAAGVTAMLNISTREREWDDVVATAEREPDVWASIGIHPHEAGAHPDMDTEKLIARAAHPRVVGIGERAGSTITTIIPTGRGSAQAFVRTLERAVRPDCP